MRRDFKFLLYTILDDLNVVSLTASETLDSAETLDAITGTHLLVRITPKGYFPVDCVASVFLVGPRGPCGWIASSRGRVYITTSDAPPRRERPQPFVFFTIMTSTSTVHGNWRRASSSADIDLEARTITGTHAPFALPISLEPTRTAAAPTRTPHGTTDAIDDFFGVTRPRATRESQHPSLGGDIPPPPYADSDPPAYSADPNTEPITLAMYLFKFGFRTCHVRVASDV